MPGEVQKCPDHQQRAAEQAAPFETGQAAFFGQAVKFRQPGQRKKTMMRRNTPSEISELPENIAAMITVQRITVVINRRRKTCALEGVWAGAAASDIRGN